MKGKTVAWHNGKQVVLADAEISVLSHALHYGSGAYEGIRAYKTADGPAIFRLDDHVARLFRSAAALHIKIPYTKADIKNAAKKIVLQNHLQECYIRPLVFYGEGQMGLFPSGAKIHVVVTAWPWGAYLGGHGALSVGISPYIRFHPKSTVSGVKISGLYAVSVMATQEARSRGFNECIMLDHEGFVAEGPGENIFIVKQGKLITPKSASILEGITRDSVMRIAKDLKIPVVEKKVTPKELMSADEAFFTGTAAEIGMIGKINNRIIGNGAIGAITKNIREVYIAAVHGNLPRYRKWITLA